MEKKDIDNLKRLRKEIFLAAYAGGMGHLASAYSSLEIIYTLYQKEIIKINKESFQKNAHDHLCLVKDMQV